MEKKTKDQSIVESNFKKWYAAEKERIASKGKDIDRIYIFADYEIDKGTILCKDYALTFNRHQRVIDLIVNGEEGSSIWDDVVDNVPIQFAAVFDKPEKFLYRISSITSEKKEFYHFVSTDDEGGSLLPISIDELSLLSALKAKCFDSLVDTMYNVI